MSHKLIENLALEGIYKPLIEKFTVVYVVKMCALSSLIGALLVVVTNSILISYLGFALLGIGYSIIMPLAFSRAANLDKLNAGSAIAGIATFAYGGMLLGPVLLGLFVDIFSLRVAFMIFVVLSLYVYFTARHLEPKLKSSGELPYTQAKNEN